MTSLDLHHQDKGNELLNVQVLLNLIHAKSAVFPPGNWRSDFHATFSH